MLRKGFKWETGIVGVKRGGKIWAKDINVEVLIHRYRWSRKSEWASLGKENRVGGGSRRSSMKWWEQYERLAKETRAVREMGGNQENTVSQKLKEG